MPVYRQANSRHWIVEFTLDGKRFRRSSGTPSKRIAERLERKWREEAHQGKFDIAKRDPMTLGDAIDRYRTTVIDAGSSREKSKKAEACAMAVIARHFGPDTQIDAIKTATIAKWRDNMLAARKAPATINRYLATLRAILNRAHKEWNALAQVPSFRLLPLDNWRYRYVTEDEERRILAVSPPHLQALIIFLVDTGARLSEAVDLTWPDVDLGAPRAAVQFMRTKTKTPRRVPLTSRVRDLLVTLRNATKHYGERVFLYRARGTKVSVPFHQPFGSWKTALRRAGIDTSLHIHDLRHTFASRLVSRGVPLLDVSKLLGHRTISMTMRYAHLAPDAYEAAIERLENGQGQTQVQ